MNTLLLHLPDELLLDIARKTRNSLCHFHSDLLPLSLTCRRLNRALRAELWRALIFRIDKAERVFRTLTTFPHLVSLIQGVDAYVEDDGALQFHEHPTFKAICVAFFCSILMLLPQIKFLAISAFGTELELLSGELVRAITGLGELKTLNLQDLGSETEEEGAFSWKRMRGAALSSLSLYETRVGPYKNVDGLQSFSFSEQCGGERGELRKAINLANNCRKSLYTLALKTDSSEELDQKLFVVGSSKDDGGALKLTNLTLNIAATKSPLTLSSLENVFRRLSVGSLRHLTLELHLAYNPITLYLAPDILFPTIQSLTLKCSLSEKDRSKVVFKFCRHFPNLTHLILPDLASDYRGSKVAGKSFEAFIMDHTFTFLLLSLLQSTKVISLESGNLHFHRLETDSTATFKIDSFTTPRKWSTFRSDF